MTMDAATNATAAPAEAERRHGAFDPRELLRTLSAQRWLVAAGTTAIVIAAALYSFSATPFHRASLRVLIERDRERLLSFQEIYDLGTGADDYYVTQHRILESRAIAEAALARLPAADRRWFQDRLDPTQALLDLRRIRPVAKSRLVDVQVEHPDPAVARRAAEAMVAAYVDNVQQRQTSASSSALAKLRDEAAALALQLVDAEQATQEFKARHKIISMNDRQSLVAARLEKLADELAEVERQRREAEAHVATAHAALAEGSFRDDLPEVLDSQVVAQHKRQLLEAEEQRSGLVQRYKPLHPRMQAAERRLVAIEGQLAREVDAIYRGISRRHDQLSKHEADVRRRLQEQGDELLEMERKSIEYQVLRNEADNVRRLHDQIQARLKEVEVMDQHRGTNVHAIGDAEVSPRPVRPRPFLNLALALLIGLLLSCGLAFAVDALDRSIKTPADATRLLGLPVLGLVPRLEGRRDARGAVDPETFDARSTLSEAFRTIRTNLTFSEAGRDVRSLVVTSATAAEGKSLVSINLAVAMARAGKRVLLVDADMRRPRLHRAFGREVEEGLSSVLVGARALREVACPTPEPKLMLLPCGIIPPNPVELLGGSHTAAFLAAALAEFDLVVFDSPPVGLVSDACVLGTRADRVAFVVRSFKTDRGLSRRAVAQLAGVGARLAGLVLNHCDARAERYGSEEYRYGYLYEYAEEAAGQRRRGRRRADAARTAPEAPR